MTHTPRLQHNIQRFANRPALPMPEINDVCHWHMHQPGETEDERLPGVLDNDGKGAYPVNWEGLGSRQPDGPRYLEMEIGPDVYKGGQNFDQLGYVGKVAGVVEPDCVYGNSWAPGPYESGSPDELRADLATYALIGCPDRLAVSLYGAWSLRWAGERADKIARACRLADAIKWKAVRPVFFISPFVAKNGDTPAYTMDDNEWWQVCMFTFMVCIAAGADAIMFWDGGEDRPEWPEEHQRKVDTLADVWANARKVE